MTNRAALPWVCVAAMAVIVAVSNKLANVQFNDWLVWGAFTYPLAYLVTDITNRLYGVRMARKVALVGFVVGVILSLIFADTRIALASGTAFFVSQMLDVTVFDKLRQQAWWIAPIASSAISSIVDTALFFSLAFVGTGLPWTQWATGDLAVKLLVALLALIPFAAITLRARPTVSPGS